ncbi:helix-turn-helix transcriptional regulator [Luteibacter sp.]|uniref:helix-turn-helix domain-containing protein n=1 Tax=Luteibacter sp. TaxID=1886636 RepID=UPI002FCD43F4
MHTMGCMKSSLTISESVGAAIASFRVEAGLSQEELAFSAGVHRTYISLLERGVKSPTVNTLSCIAHALGMKTSELVRVAELHIDRRVR